jgi:hypothetical protein
VLKHGNFYKISGGVGLENNMGGGGIYVSRIVTRKQDKAMMQQLLVNE